MCPHFFYWALAFCASLSHTHTHTHREVYFWPICRCLADNNQAPSLSVSFFLYRDLSANKFQWSCACYGNGQHTCVGSKGTLSTALSGLQPCRDEITSLYACDRHSLIDNDWMPIRTHDNSFEVIRFWGLGGNHPSCDVKSRFNNMQPTLNALFHFGDGYTEMIALSSLILARFSASALLGFYHSDFCQRVKVRHKCQHRPSCHACMPKSQPIDWVLVTCFIECWSCASSLSRWKHEGEAKKTKIQ